MEAITVQKRNEPSRAVANSSVLERSSVQLAVRKSSPSEAGSLSALFAGSPRGDYLRAVRARANSGPGIQRVVDVQQRLRNRSMRSVDSQLRGITTNRMQVSQLLPISSTEPIQRVSEEVKMLATALGVGLVVAGSIYFLLPSSLVAAIIAGNLRLVAASLGFIAGTTEWLSSYIYNWLLRQDPRLEGYMSLLETLYASLNSDPGPLGDAGELDELVYGFYGEDRGQERFSARPSGHDWRDMIEAIATPPGVEADWGEQKYSYVHFVNDQVGDYPRSQKRRIALNAKPDDAIAAMTYVAQDIVSQPWVDSAKITWESRDYEKRLDPIVIYYYDDNGRRTDWIQRQLTRVPKRDKTPAGLTPLEPGLATAPQEGGSFGGRIAKTLTKRWAGKPLPGKAQFIGQSLEALKAAGLL